MQTKKLRQGNSKWAGSLSVKVSKKNKALLTSILCLFSRPIDGVTVKCNHTILENEDKNCKSSVKKIVKIQ